MCEAQKNLHNTTSNTSGDVNGLSKVSETSRGSPTCKDVNEISEAVDGGWGWVVTVSSLMHSFLVDGICLSFGTFFKEFLTFFGGSNGRTQLLSSILSGGYLSMGLVSGALMNRFGCRRLTIVGVIVASVGLFLSTFSPNLDVMILLYGVVGGVGFGLVYTPSVVIVGHYFHKHRALATGIAVCGSGLGGFVFAPLSALLIETYGWKGAMWILSAIVLNGVVFAAFYRPPPKPKSSVLDSPTGSATFNVKDNSHSKQFILAFKQTFNFPLLVSPTFALYSFSGILVCTGFFIPFNFLPAFASDRDLSTSKGALLISVMGIFNTVSRVLVGLLSDQSWADCILINSITLFIGGIATCFVPLYNTYAILITYSAMFGITVGALSDLTDSYNAAFYFSGGTIGLAGLLCFPLRHIARWEHDRYPREDEIAEPRLTSMRIHHM